MTHPLETLPPWTSPNLPFLQLDQIAYCARTDSDVIAIKTALNLQDARWIEDEVKARGFVAGNMHDQINLAHLRFNYDFGIEIEILRYLEGENYLDALDIPSRAVAHFGFHFKPDAPEKTVNAIFPFCGSVAQRVTTLRHTNVAVNQANRRYRYTIYDTRGFLGACCKVIERLEVGDE